MRLPCASAHATGRSRLSSRGRHERRAIRVVAHISDLHFGRTEPGLAEALADAVRQLRPHLTVVSGDLTQDARDSEFAEARGFLDSLPLPRIVIPGNHDMPFYNPLRRMIVRLSRYRRWISAELEPRYSDDEIVVVSANTVRLFPIRGGRINLRQVGGVQEAMRGAPPGSVRILVTHHPFDLDPQFRARDLVGRAELAMDRLARCIDILLAGHMHVAHSGHTAIRYRSGGHSAIFVQAGTAISTRVRGEPNSFNVLRIDRGRLQIERFAWSPQAKLFVSQLTDAFARRNGEWVRLPEDQVLRAG